MIDYETVTYPSSQTITFAEPITECDIIVNGFSLEEVIHYVLLKDDAMKSITAERLRVAAKAITHELAVKMRIRQGDK
jgi:hypothetical protein